LNLDLGALEIALARGPINEGHGRYRARSAAAAAQWLEVAPSLRDAPLSGPQCAYAAELTGALLDLIARHPAATPGHGAGHARRVAAHGIILALSEELGHADTARLLLGAVSHDLGRLVLEGDSSELAHAEVSGLLVNEFAGALAPLGAAIGRTVQEAARTHTLAPAGEKLYFRALDDVRTADGLDAIGVGAGLVRSVIHAATFAELRAELPTSSLANPWEERVWLDGWRWYSQNPAPPPIRLSAWGRAERRARTGAGGALIRDLPHLSGDAAAMLPDFRALAEVVEPDAAPAALAQLAQRLSELALRERERWAGLLLRVKEGYAQEAAHLRETLEAAVETDDSLIAPVAHKLLADGVARDL